mmetsp:Transcript_61346/g.109339  ORF Transcript_61346/g.109339 Transcript_61346/m.109339 type:complete len:155 (+) Transcript_61346:66-530(+)
MKARCSITFAVFFLSCSNALGFSRMLHGNHYLNLLHSRQEASHVVAGTASKSAGFLRAVHKADAQQMLKVSDLEERDAAAEEMRAHNHVADARSIETVAAHQAKWAEKSRMGKDAMQLEELAAKELRDVVATRSQVKRLRQDVVQLRAEAGLRP